MKKMELNSGNTIFKKGDPADGLYIVGKGSVGIYFPTNHTMECGTHRSPIGLLKSQGNPEATVHGVTKHGNFAPQG